MKKNNIFLINGPNLNLLGTREPDIYGYLKYDKLIKKLHEKSNKLNLNIIDFQSNSESKIINFIHNYIKNKIELIIINAGAFSHTSIAIRDSLYLTKLPIIEVHISNIFKREKFRKNSYISEISISTICGFGIYGYFFALEYSNIYLNKNT